MMSDGYLGIARILSHGRAAEVAFARGNKLDMIITCDGNLYARNPLSTGDIYGFPINVTSDGQRFEVAPYFGHRSGCSRGRERYHL